MGEYFSVARNFLHYCINGVGGFPGESSIKKTGILPTIVPYKKKRELFLGISTLISD